MLTGLLGIVCALLGIFAAPPLFLPLAIAFSAVALVRSLAALRLAGTIAATLSCILTVIGLVMFPLGAQNGQRAATTSSSAVPAAPSQAPAQPPANPARREPVPPKKPVEPSPATGSLSLPPAAPEPAPAPAVQPKEEAGPAPPPLDPAAASAPQPQLEHALPEPPPPAAAVVPDPVTPPLAATTETPKAAAASDAAKANQQPWPESRTEQTRVIQILLRDLNFYHGTTNGTFGPGTRAAICLYLVTYDEKGECEPTKALYDSLQKRRNNANVGNAPR